MYYYILWTVVGTYNIITSLVWRLAISDCLVGGLRNRALDYTSSGMCNFGGMGPAILVVELVWS